MLGFFKKKAGSDVSKKKITKNTNELFKEARLSRDPRIAVDPYSDAIDVEKQK